jgi:hypothetical protein
MQHMLNINAGDLKGLTRVSRGHCDKPPKDLAGVEVKLLYAASERATATFLGSLNPQ